MQAQLIEGDLLDQQVDLIVNAWNRNIIPWWLLIPQGVSGAIKKRGGIQPFIEVARAGAMPLGSAVLTAAGRLPYKGIIHVAGINMFWVATQTSIQRSTVSAMQIVEREKFASVAFPIIGGGTGGAGEARALAWMQEALAPLESKAAVSIVRFRRRR
ncbi:MAG: Appr-p processing protein [Betaproteobacteria bacterium]|nr:Appr-p processing protein [Betaproteobacteria bacterium]